MITAAITARPRAGRARSGVGTGGISADGTGGRIGALAASTPPLVTLDDIEAARRLLAPVVRRTPVEGSEHLSALAGRPILLKAEHLQRTGSFKIRGAYHRIARLDPAERAAGVVAASAGNHAQGVALAASLLGVKSTIFMPATAPFPKVAATRGYGAEVVLGGGVFDDCLAGALAHAERDRGPLRLAVRRPAGHRRAGHHRPRAGRAGPAGRAPWWCRSAAEDSSAGWRPPSRPSGRASGSSASRRRGRRR